MDDLERAIAELSSRQAKLEASISDIGERLDPEEERLYGGSVTNLKELSAIQQEVETLKSRRSEFEEELLEVMTEIESLEADLAGAENTRDEIAGAWEQESEGLIDERETLLARLSEREARRGEIRDLMPAAPLALYDTLIGKKAGKAVVQVAGGVCSGCRVMLPDAVRRRATTSALPIQCPNCERLLSVAG